MRGAMDNPLTWASTTLELLLLLHQIVMPFNLEKTRSHATQAKIEITQRHIGS